MRVRFDHNQPLGGVGLTPWMRMGPERWFNNYAVVVQETWDRALDAGMHVTAVPGKARGTAAFMADPAALFAIRSHIKPGPVLTSHPVKPDPALLAAGYTFFAMNQKLQHSLENKVRQRELFGTFAPFPQYRIFKRSELDGSEAEFVRLLAGGERLVLQDESLGGGRGTYIVATPDEYAAALVRLAASGHIVLSAYVPHARERSVHGCVTQFGTVVGPLQTQIVRDPQLTNMQVAGGDRFCGGQITPSDPCQNAFPQIERITKQVGDVLQEQGYRGVFGLDFLVAPDGHVHLLELNPRFTGLTPLITHLWRDERDIPFYLLHILETCSLHYQLSGVADEPAEGSVLVLYNQQPHAVRMPKLGAGMYRFDAATKQLGFVRPVRDIATLAQNNTFLLERRHPSYWRYKPGARFAKLYFNRRILDANDELLPEIRDIVAAVYALAGSVSIRT